MRTLLFSFLLFFTITSPLIAQTEPSFDIRYSLNCGFESGTEKNQFTELSNGKIILYRFESDSTFGMEHFIRLWCIDQMGSTQWHRKFYIGETDSILVSAGLTSNNNKIFIAYTHIDPSETTGLRLLSLDENGSLLTSHKLTIPDVRFVRNTQVLMQNQELILAFDLFKTDSSESVVFGKIPIANFSSATWFQSLDMQKCTELYLNENQAANLIAIKNNFSVDFALNQSGPYQAIQFPQRFQPESAMQFNGSTYYVGYLKKATTINVDASLHKLENNQLSGWLRRLDATGPSYHLTTASGIANSGGKILMEGYGEVPHPVTFVSVFEQDGTPVKTELFKAFHTFNYNRGEFLKHSSGALFFAELGGIFTGTMFTTSLNRIDTSTFTSCNSQPYNYPYTDSTLQNSMTSVTFSTENYSFSTVSSTLVSDSFPDEIACHANLSLTENKTDFATIYPNPFSESFILQSEYLNGSEIKCYDLLGKEILVSKQTKGNQQILLTPLSDFSGSLFCHIQTAEGFKQIILAQKTK